MKPAVSAGPVLGYSIRDALGLGRGLYRSPRLVDRRRVDRVLAEHEHEDRDDGDPEREAEQDAEHSVAARHGA